VDVRSSELVLFLIIPRVLKPRSTMIVRIEKRLANELVVAEIGTMRVQKGLLGMNALLETFELFTPPSVLTGGPGRG